jgi:hypothetical protein
MNKAAENKTAFVGVFSDKYAPGGPVAQQIVAQQKATAAADAVRDKAVSEQMVPALLGLGVLGVGAGLTGTKLYNLISRLNAPKDKYMKFGPGPKRIDEDEKIAAESWTQAIVDAVTAVPKNVGASLSSGSELFNSLTPNQQAVLMPAGLLSGGLGLYGGYRLAKAIEDKKKKEDSEYEVEQARKEYQRALTGKRAEAIDKAFALYKQSAAKTATNPVSLATTVGDYLAEPLRQTGVWPYYTTALLGAGLLSGKMTYDWTRERSKDKALERARRSRARMEETAPLYVDPSQLEAIKALHQKEVDKVKSKELV